MIKHLIRFLIVCGFSVLVSGSLYLIFSNTSPLTSTDDRPAMPAGEFGEAFQGTEGQRVRPDGKSGAGLLNFGGVLLNLGKVTLISLVIVLINKVSERISLKRKHKFIPNG